jgi:ABC-2 type transport system ATP-binding protein
MISNNQAAIAVRDLVKVYAGRSSTPVRALDGLSLEVRRGEIYGLLGRNGAGKTTLLRVLTTLTRPTSGTVTVMGHDVVAHPLEVRRSLCAVLQENAVELFLSVRDNLAVYARFHGIPRGEIRPRADRALEQFGLTEHAAKKVIDLSGGLKRRVQVAKVFMVDKPLIFLDEATTGMDPVNKRAALDAIREQARRGRTVFLTTHILQEAEELCDTITIIDRGRVLATGDLQAIKRLASGVYDVGVTFDELTEQICEEFRRLGPVKFARKGNTLELSVRGSQAPLLEVVSRCAASNRVLHFEVASASLEDVFLDLLGGGDAR